MAPSREWLQGATGDDLTERSRLPIYGVNTGFGSLAGREVFARPEDSWELSRRLVLSNAAGSGRDLDNEVVRAAMLIRAQGLTRGFSGVRTEIVTSLVAMLNADVRPAIPEYGSLGASGDLMPLAHLALVLCEADEAKESAAASGRAYLDGRIVSGAEAMAVAGVPQISFGPKEALSFLNGTCFSAALCALAVTDAAQLVRTSEVALAMTAQATLGFGDAFVADLHAARGHAGQTESAAAVRELLAGSDWIDGGRERDPERQPPQDAYSIRCAPQVLGPVRDTVAFVRGIAETEINAVTDNPLICADLPDSRTLKAISGGNFHAEYVGFGSDFLTIALTELGSIAERRIFRLTDGTLNRGLPDMLIASEQVGMDCGFMLPQFLTAALVSDSKTLAHPDSVDSIPTSANQEDHVSMAMNAGRHLRTVVANMTTVVAVELLMAAQAIDLRARQGDRDIGTLSAPTRRVFELIRSQVDYQTRDQVMRPRIEAIVDLISSGAILGAAEQG
jgi:histidine ammonia-lyase